MATPLSADRLVRILRDEGLTVHEYRSWRDHNRNHKGAWGPINGVMIHHTVTRGTSGSVRLCYDGYSSLPGPLCHGVIDKNGVVYLVGNGRANHAGLGDDNVLADVINERELSPDNEANTDGNARFYGFECVNMGDGEDPWPDAQLEAIEKTAAAICRAYDWDAESVLGHLEWQPGKIDPRGFGMDWMRRRIATRLGNPPTQQEDDMPSAKEVADEVFDRIFNHDGVPVPASWGAPGNDHWKYASVIASDGDRQRRIETAVRELAARGAARDAVLAHLTTGGGLTGAELTAAAEAGADRALAKLVTALNDTDKES